MIRRAHLETEEEASSGNHAWTLQGLFSAKFKEFGPLPGPGSGGNVITPI